MPYTNFKIQKLIFFFIIIGYTFACTYHSEEDLYPPASLNYDTINISYNNTVIPMLNNHCNNCHSDYYAPVLGGDISLESYQDVIITVNNGSFYGSIAYEPNFTPMPTDYALPDSTIHQIKIWIDNGAQNN